LFGTDSPGAESPQKEGFKVATPRYLGTVNGWAANTKLPPYDDVKVRQAFQAGINRQEIIDTVYTPDWQQVGRISIRPSSAFQLLA
jgi:ABC-type transport system substrate-binding protein